MSEEQVDRELRDFAATMQQYTEALEAGLYARHPALVRWLEMTITARPISGGGWDVGGEIYGTIEQAHEAVKTAIVHKLIEADRSTP